MSGLFLQAQAIDLITAAAFGVVLGVLSLIGWLMKASFKYETDRLKAHYEQDFPGISAPREDERWLSL